MYKKIPRFTTGQELATRYWWNVTQLAAVAVQDVFLIVYSAMDDTSNGTKSIADYCSEHFKDHVTQDLQDEGYDQSKFTSNPREVFFDLQLTRKLMDKALVEDENRDLLDRIRKKVRWLVYQRNDVCHEMLQSLEILKLKLKLGTLKGVIRQLYNLASQFSSISKDKTDEALEYFLDELEVHRSITSTTNENFSSRRGRFRFRRIRKMCNDESSEYSEDSPDSLDKSEREDSQDSQDTSDKEESTDKSEKEESIDKLEKEDSTHTSDKEESKYGDVIKALGRDQNGIEETYKYKQPRMENKDDGRICDNMREVNEHQSIYARNDIPHNEGERSVSHQSKYTEGSYQEICQIQGSTIMIQVGLYCSKGLHGQYENIQTTLPRGEELMVYWQRCFCGSHQQKEEPPKSYFVPPKINIRTRSKSLGRKASHYLLMHQHRSRRKFIAKKAKSIKVKRSLWDVLEHVETAVPEIKRGIFGNKWEDKIRREEAIVAIENWETLIAEEEWINEGWGDFEDPPVPSESNTETSVEQLNDESSLDGSYTSEIQDSDASEKQCTCRVDCSTCVSMPADATYYHGKRSNSSIMFATVILLVSAFVASIVLFMSVVGALIAVATGKVLTLLLDLLLFLSIFSHFGCVIFIIFILVKFLLVVIISLIKIASVFLYFIKYCNELEKRSSTVLQKLDCS